MILHIRTLKALGQPVESWDTLLIQNLLPKIDKSIREEWQEFTNELILPKFNECIEFLTKKSNTFESIATDIKNQFSNFKDTSTKAINNRKVALSQNNVSCVICNADHIIYNCSTFLNLSVQERINTAKDKKLCLNGLRNTHFSNYCRAGPCRKCHFKHNALLHLNKTEENKALTIKNLMKQPHPTHVYTAPMHQQSY